MNENIIKNDLVYEGIPLSIYYKNDGLKKPLIYFFHGFTGNRNIGLMGRGEVLAEKGFFVVAMDAYLHGDRQPEFFKQLPSSEKQRDIMNIVIHTANDAKHLYHKYFKKLPEILPNKIYAYGVSMGAATAFYFASITEEVKTFVSIVGSPSLYDFYLHKLSFYKWNNDQYFQINLDSYKELCPLINFQRLKNKNIYMANGSIDTIVPLKYAEELNEKLKSDNVVFKIYDVAHTSTPEMLEESYDFLLKH
jgi:predicted esterase